MDASVRTHVREVREMKTRHKHADPVAMPAETLAGEPNPRFPSGGAGLIRPRRFRPAPPGRRVLNGFRRSASTCRLRRHPAAVNARSLQSRFETDRWIADPPLYVESAKPSCPQPTTRFSEKNDARREFVGAKLASPPTG
jgi:hypothetical protein